jgi:hypothetical protein
MAVVHNSHGLATREVTLERACGLTMFKTAPIFFLAVGIGLDPYTVFPSLLIVLIDAVAGLTYGWRGQEGSQHQSRDDPYHHFYSFGVHTKIVKHYDIKKGCPY